MIVSFKGSFLGLIAWQRRNALLFVSTAVAAQLLHEHLGMAHLKLPPLPLTVAGAALGIFVSFRTNACYARWWEGRQLWGRLINSSRHLASQALINLDPDTARAVVRRQIAYAHLLRCGLRDQDPFADADVREFLTDDERARWKGDSNPCFAALHAHRVAITARADAGALHEDRLLAMDATLGSLLDVQGGCERIKKTPFPRAYNYIAERLILAFGVMLPFGMVEALGWVTVPMNLLVCGAFAMISEVGRVLEDPFTLFWNGLPLHALSKTIEANLRHRMGETDVPPIPKPDDKGVLM